MKRARLPLVAGLVLLVVYLLAWPVVVEPVAWEAPPPSPLVPTGKLQVTRRLALGGGQGPEGTAVGPDGAIYAGLVDGRVVRLEPGSGAVTELFNAGGRPMGMQVDRAGGLVVCDAKKGLLRWHNGTVTTLVDGEGGVPFGFTDDVDEDADGLLYFTDASTRFDVFHYRMDALEHGTTGRLLVFDPATKTTRRLLDGISFANGVALSGDGSFVAFTETWNYRVRRYWLRGPKAGSVDTLIENLPGFPDNITFSRARGVFWVALFSPRNPALDAVAPYPFLRRITARLPEFLQPQVADEALALAVREDGSVAHLLLSDGKDAYFPITSVLEQNGQLVLGSLTQPTVALAKAPPLP